MILIGMASIAFLLATVVALLFCGARPDAVDVSDLTQRLRSVDVDAFLNLVDCREKAYLSEHLPVRLFHKIHHERMFAAMQYTWHAARNARLLMHFAVAMKDGFDSTAAGQAEALYTEALDLRICAFRTTARLLLSAALPGQGVVPEAFASSYHWTSGRFLALAHQRAAVELSRAA